MNINFNRIIPLSREVFASNMSQITAFYNNQMETLKDITKTLDTLKELYESIPSELTNQFNSSYNYLSKKIESLTIEQQQIGDLISSVNGVSKNLESIIGSLSVLMKAETPIDVTFERKYYKNFLSDAKFGTANFKENFLSLVKNLDSQSIDTITTAFSRLHILQKIDTPVLALYNNEEKEIMKYRIDHFFPNIIKLSEECYYYQNFLLPLSHFEMNVFLDFCGVAYLKNSDSFYNKDIIDAGAFIGDSAIVLSKFTSGIVHSFEPDPSNFHLLQKTLGMNRIDNIVATNCALGNHTGTISLSTYKSASTQFENKAFEYESTIEAPVTTLDHYVQQHNISVGLIKVDVEGAEQLLLQGAKETICKQRPTLLISIYHSADDFMHIKPMIESWGLDYKFKIVHPVCGTILTETLLIAETK